MRGLDRDIYREYLSRRDEDPVYEPPVGVRLSSGDRDSSRELTNELQTARKELSALNDRRQRIDRVRLGSAAASNGQLGTLEATHDEILRETDRLHNWLVTLGLYEEVRAEIRYIYARLKRLEERKDKADQLRSARRSMGQPWPRHWEAELQRILSEIRNLEHRALQKKILISKSKSGGWT